MRIQHESLFDVILFDGSHGPTACSSQRGLGGLTLNMQTTFTVVALT
jgi:hypothetical protein